MRSLDELFKELGFDPNGSADVQKAFVKNLIKSAEADYKASNLVVPVGAGQTPSKESKTEQPVQLEFNFDAPDTPKKVS